jgi:hypothetical protein
MAEVGSLSAERKGLRQLSTNSASVRQGSGAENGKRKKPKKDKKKVDDEITVNSRRYVRGCATRALHSSRGTCAHTSRATASPFAGGNVLKQQLNSQRHRLHRHRLRRLQTRLPVRTDLQMLRQTAEQAKASVHSRCTHSSN